MGPSVILFGNWYNPRLQVASAEEYGQIMDNLGLANPQQMGVAVPANLAIGMDQARPDAAGRMLAAADGVEQLGRTGLIFVDLREEAERAKTGVIPTSVHAPYQQLADFVKPGGILVAMAGKEGNELFFIAPMANVRPWPWIWRWRRA